MMLPGDPVAAPWPREQAPTTLAQIVAAFAVHGALIVSTRVGDDVEARTIVHLDGDVTTMISPTCLSESGPKELLRRHEAAMRNVGALLRNGAASATIRTTLVAAVVVVTSTIVDLVVGHSRAHVLAVLGSVTSVSVLAVSAMWKLSVWILMRRARREIVRLRGVASSM